MNRFEIEVTDTFGGQANYSWVNRRTIKLPKGASDLCIVRAAKRELGWNGLRCRTDMYGDGFTLRPFGMCQVMFINYIYE